MKRHFKPLIEELGRWRDEGLTLPIWWRDDDAVAPTPELERLFALAERFEAPLYLSVIPRSARQILAKRLREETRVYALPHGWQQQNYAPASEKNAEFGAHRPTHLMLGEAALGWQRIENLFGPKALPVFVPPWNRVSPALVKRLPDCGLRAISTFKPRLKKHPAPGVLQVNTHCDPIAWRGDGSLDFPDAITAKTVAQLVTRRLGIADNSEPYGLLTHHLDHDERVWSFVETLLTVLAESEVTKWTPPLDHS